MLVAVYKKGYQILHEALLYKVLYILYYNVMGTANISRRALLVCLTANLQGVLTYGMCKSKWQNMVTAQEVVRLLCYILITF
jgi:hypothetical protein